ncbi:MAG: hypothetical protein EYC62_06925 [Alphaproteobacteria bacterium]|nr:MAG: hypothetical protein EYC62_06925 [Alphaproteobacteria bacterium]
MLKNVFFAVVFGLFLTAFSNVANAQVLHTISGEAVAVGDAMEICHADGDVAVAMARPAGCLLMECWMTCNVPGIGNTYETALQCGTTTSQSLRTSCSLAGGSVTSMTCRPRGYSSSRCAPPTSPPVVIPGPLPW